MSKKRNAKIGDFVQIPLGDGTYGYGKVLTGAEIAFLDLRTQTGVVQTDALYSARSLFRIWVMTYALKASGSWTVVGHQSLTEDELLNHTYFKKDSISGKLSLYHSGERYERGYKEWSADYEDCEGLERAAVWDPEHVESRLLDHFEGRPNKWVQSMVLEPR